MRVGGDDLVVLVGDLDAAIQELTAVAGHEPALWERGWPGKWTIGQHTAHVGIVLTRTTELFEAAERSFRSGTLPPPPARRDLLQSLFVSVVVRRGFMPRGGKSAPWAVPPERPEREATLEALRRGADRHRQLGGRLGATERDRLWIANPFMARWYYRLPEMVRMHAVHARHHAKQIAEVAARRG